jgi:predicted nuclease with TOPRIM domain
MKKLSAFFLAAAVILSVSMLAGCKGESTVEEPVQDNTELEKTQKELEQIKQDSTELDKYVTNLKNEINSLKIENQRLIAQTKRLEAEIIDLKLALGEIPDGDSADMLDKDAEPADGTSAAESKEPAPETNQSGK